MTWSDVRLALRLTRRQPVAAATSILALAAAIGLSVGAFTFARGFVFPDLDMPGGDRLHQVRMSRSIPNSTEHPYPAEVRAWASEARNADSVGAFQFVSPPLQIADETARPVEAARVTPGPYAKLAPAPLLGRHLTDADAVPGASAVVVLSEALWRGRFNADANVIDRIVRVAGAPHRVVGVMPKGWAFPVMERMWLPLGLDNLDGDQGHNLVVWAVLSREATSDSAQAEFTNLARGLASEDQRDKIALNVVPYVDGFTNGVGTPASALVLGLLLIFLCGVSLNVANLMLARCASRADELALRTALGASRSRIVGLLFLESLVISLTATVIGVVAVERGLSWVQAKIGGGPFWLNLSIDPVVVLYSVVLAITASALAGIVPALRVTRGRAVPGISGKGRLSPIALGRFASVLLGAQLAASLALLATAGLLAEGLLTYRGRSRTFEPRVLTALLYRDPAISGVKAEWGSPELHDLRIQVERALASMPGATAAAVSISLPRAHDDDALVEVEDKAVQGLRVQETQAGPGFFEVLGIRPTFGRTFEPADARPGGPRVAVVSERFVRDVLDGQPAVGRRFRWMPSRTGDWIEIIGVIPDLGMNPGDRSAHGEVFLPLVGTDFMYASVRTDGPPEALGPTLRTAIAALDPRIRVTDVMDLSEVGWEARTFLSGAGGVLLLLGGLALLLSLAGVYALASLAVTSRTKEIGIRMALGATTQQVLAPVLGRTALQLGLGTGAGIALAMLLARVLDSLPFAMPMSIGIAVPAAAALLLIAGVVASWLPARRAMRVDPVNALRAD